MLILRGIQDSEGNVWRCNLKNLSVVEVTIPEASKTEVLDVTLSNIPVLHNNCDDINTKITDTNIIRTLLIK